MVKEHRLYNLINSMFNFLFLSFTNLGALENYLMSQCLNILSIKNEFLCLADRAFLKN